MGPSCLGRKKGRVDSWSRKCCLLITRILIQAVGQRGGTPPFLYVLFESDCQLIRRGPPSPPRIRARTIRFTQSTDSNTRLI